MSLLVLNSSSSIAKGLIKNFYNKGQFEKIVCADLYPSYSSIQQYCQLKESLQQSETKIEDKKFENRQDLHELIKKSSHVLHVTHDYYQFVTPKQNVLQTCAQISNEYNIKNFLSLNPIEHKHQYDTDNQNVDLISINSQYKQINCDLVYGEYATTINKLIYYLQNKKSLDFQPSKESVSPINDEDLALYCEKAFQNSELNSNIKGNNEFTFSQILSILEQNTKISRTQPGLLENIVSPLSNNILSQYIHSAEYRNLVQLLHNYKSFQGDCVGNKSFEEFYKNYQAKAQKQQGYFEKLMF